LDDDDDDGGNDHLDLKDEKEGEYLLLPCLYHYYYPTDGDDVDDNCHDY